MRGQAAIEEYRRQQEEEFYRDLPHLKQAAEIGDCATRPLCGNEGSSLSLRHPYQPKDLPFRGPCGQMAASRSTVSGNRFTSLISNAAWAFGLARPCSQFSRVRTLVRR